MKVTLQATFVSSIIQYFFSRVASGVIVYSRFRWFLFLAGEEFNWVSENRSLVTATGARNISSRKGEKSLYLGVFGYFLWFQDESNQFLLKRS